ncbi:hypothetical protein BGZ76_009579 [Entomortierella beljakovae]|nr:hypothetical protein BGZ76_009579 [Entomortierella beljakovae]
MAGEGETGVGTSEDSNASGRQRVRTEPSPRHQPSGWLGPYNEFPSPVPSSRSPRGPRQPGSHHSPSIAEERGGPGPGSTLSVGGGFDRIIDSHRALGRWYNDGSSGGGDAPTSISSGGSFKRREFDPKQNETGYSSVPLMEPSNSLQSLVESIDDDHVFKLTEMTKKRVEHNNPGQKRQRVVSLPTSEASLGYPINRLQKLHEIYPQLHPATFQRNTTHEGKHSGDSSLPRSRWLKSSKYRFVDKVVESTCIWDVDHMESKYNEQVQLNEAANVAKISVSRYGSQHSLSHVDSSSTTESSIQPLQSISTDSIVAGGSKDSSIPPNIITSQSYQDSPLAVVDNQNIPIGMSPSSTFSSITSPNQSPLTPESSIQRRQSKDHSGESRLRFVEPNPSKITMTPVVKTADGNKSSIGSPDSSNTDSTTNKRHSFLGIFDRRGKKVDNDHWNNNHHESPQSSSGYGSPRLVATGSTQECPSSESQQSPHVIPSNSSTLAQRSHQTSEATSVSEAVSKGRVSIDGVQTPKYNDTVGPSTDDDNGGQVAFHYAQGESQDESDSPITAADKRSSLRRLKDKMSWKRGNKGLATIHQNESAQQASANTTHGKQMDGAKSSGKKLDPSLAYLHESSSARGTTSEPSSGRNSIDYPTRPKSQAHRSPSGTSSPTIDASKSPDIITGQGISSPRFGPSSGIPDTVRSEKSPLVNPLKMDRSPMVHPTTKSPMINPRTDKSPMIAPVVGSGDDQATGVASHLILDVDRIPKRLLERLKARPELGSIDWSEDTVDLTPILSSSEPMPTYEEYLGISSDMKSLKIYPTYLEDIDVVEIHLTMGSEDLRNNSAKSRVRKWDLLELRLDQEIDNSEKWMKHIEDWTSSKSKSIEKHRQQEIDSIYGEGGRFLDESMPLVEEPENEAEDEAEDEADGGHLQNPMVSIVVQSPTRRRSKDNFEPSGPKDALRNFSFNQGAARARRQQRELSLLSVRDLSAGGSSMSLHHQNSASVSYTFRASLDSTREAVNEMRVYLTECRERLMQLNVATELLKKEPMFKDIVDLFAREWNDSYFVKLKEVEDQIQVMNLKRIENPWMDMLLIMLSWFIRGLFYLVEGVTIIIIIVRHAWSKTKRGFGVLRSAKREQVRLSYGGGRGGVGSGSGSQTELSNLDNQVNRALPSEA